MCPVKDEAWILEIFLRHHAALFDEIIIADQMSTDGSREIASRFPNVLIIDNTSVQFDEPHMRQIMLEEARRRHGLGNLLFALDADELLIAESGLERTLNLLLRHPQGVRFSIKRRNYLPNLDDYWEVEGGVVAFLDDGSNFPAGGRIHAPRVPELKGQSVLGIYGSFQAHLQFVDWLRMESKHSWYRRWELVELKRPLAAVWRRYSHMYSIPESSVFRGGLPDSIRRALGEASGLWPEGYRWDNESRQMELKMSGGALRVLRALESGDPEPLHLKFRERLTFRYLHRTVKKSNPTFSPVRHQLYMIADFAVSLIIRLR